MDLLRVLSYISVMTEITKKSISPVIERFILHWGDLGGRWGVNRSVAQIHALLLVSDRPLTAEDIAETLNLARSNVSNSLKDLLGWDLVRRKPILGDRREHFEAEGDVWEMATKIVAMRKAREIDPTATVLRDCLIEAQRDPHVNPSTVRRLAELQELVDTLNSWYEQMSVVPKATLLPLIRMGSKAVELLAPLLKRKS